MIGKTFSGLEYILEEELLRLGASSVKQLTRGVEFQGPKELLYKANYRCRTAIRFLKPILSFKVYDEQDLYQQVKKYHWHKLFSVSETFAIDAVVNNSRIRHSKYAALKAKDAIVDQFRERSGRRPSIDVNNPTIRLHLHINHNQCTISLDSSGNSLHLRGYRAQTGIAPINEVLAAGLILLTGWRGETHLIDPMCGSGTFLIEAAMIAKSIPAGYYRKEFGFQRWKDFDLELWHQVKKVADASVQELKASIQGSDIAEKAIRISRNNLLNAGLDKEVQVMTSSIERSIPHAGNGVAIINPPYGERIKPDDVIKLYVNIGDALKKSYAGYKVWVISSNMDALKFIGLKPSKKIIIYNGKLECRFAMFDIYEGSKKTKKQAI